MIDLIFSCSEMIITVGYLCRDMLFLRIILMVGLSGYVIGGSIAGIDLPGMKALVFFCSLNFLINGFQSTRLILERFPVFLPEAIKEIYTKHFYMLTTHQFLKIYKLAQIKTFQKGDFLARQDQPVPNLLMIKSGTAHILKNGAAIANLGAGFFVGEMSFLTNGQATATVEVANNGLESLEWDKEKLKKLEHSAPELYNKLKEAIAINLIKKLNPQTANPE